METIRKRHGFVSFWLWFVLIVNIVAPIIIIALFEYSRNLYSQISPEDWEAYKEYSEGGQYGYYDYDYYDYDYDYDFGLLSDDLDDVLNVEPSVMCTYITWQEVIGVINSLMMIIAFILLLKWKRSGFWLAVVSDAIYVVLDIIIVCVMFSDNSEALIEMFPWGGLFGSVTSSLVLFGILQIRVDGVSCWQYLGGYVPPTPPTPPTPPVPPTPPTPPTEYMPQE